MVNNKMTQVAAMFGKKLDEPFMVRSDIHKIAKLVKFTDVGMKYYDKMCNKWYPTEAFLRELLTGQAMIVGEGV